MEWKLVQPSWKAVEVSKEIKNKITILFSKPISGYMLLPPLIKSPTLYFSQHIHNSQGIETKYLSTDKWLKKSVVWAIYCNIILPLKEDLLICPDI
jgi:hypothetical protein